MTEPTNGDIAVVKEAYVLETAYRMGHDEFEPLDPPNEEYEMDLSPFQSGARWANHILPRLRSMAGYADGGYGTYQQERQVALIHPGCEEDEPAEADLVDGHLVFNALVDAYCTGAYDGWEGDTWDPDSVQHTI